MRASKVTITMIFILLSLVSRVAVADTEVGTGGVLIKDLNSVTQDIKASERDYHVLLMNSDRAKATQLAYSLHKGMIEEDWNTASEALEKARVGGYGVGFHEKRRAHAIKHRDISIAAFHKANRLRRQRMGLGDGKKIDPFQEMADGLSSSVEAGAVDAFAQDALDQLDASVAQNEERLKRFLEQHPEAATILVEDDYDLPVKSFEVAAAASLVAATRWEIERGKSERAKLLLAIAEGKILSGARKAELAAAGDSGVGGPDDSGLF